MSVFPISYQKPGMSSLTYPACIWGVNKSPVKILGFVFRAGLSLYVITMTHQLARVRVQCCCKRN
jgi:hypothetical protein